MDMQVERTPEEREALRNYIRENVAVSREVVDYLGVSRARLNQYVKTGRIEPILPGFYLKADIEAFDRAFDEARENKKWLTEFK